MKTEDVWTEKNLAKTFGAPTAKRSETSPFSEIEKRGNSESAARRCRSRKQVKAARQRSISVAVTASSGLGLYFHASITPKLLSGVPFCHGDEASSPRGGQSLSVHWGRLKDRVLNELDQRIYRSA